MAGAYGIPSIAGNNKFEEYKCDANKAIHFKLVRREEDLDDESTTFHPDMTHQVFGESESIFGYKDLRVNIYCTAARMLTYIGMEYKAKICPTEADGVQADNIMKVLNEHFQSGYQSSLDLFRSTLTKDAKFGPYGELIHSYTVDKDKTGPRHFEVYRTTIDEPGFRDYHERIQPFIMFYVDAASYLDMDDERWDYFLLFEKYKCNGNPMYAFVGFMTVYNYYAYPEKVRPRISQVLILPPYQRMGHGATFVQTFYDYCMRRSTDVLDITVEDPSDDFQRVRDFVDVRNCSKLESFQPFVIKQGFSEDMVKEAKDKHKINRKQCRRIYEILRLKHTDCSVEFDYRDYRLDVKKRLNMPFQKNGRDFEKLQRALNPTELKATLNNMSNEQRLEYLDKTYNELLEEYRKVLDRLSMS